VEADAISDGKTAFVPAVMEHIELAGIHSGDSACVVPSVSISEAHLRTIKEYTRRIAVEMGVKGLMNIQYAIEGYIVYILEANPRASRTVPLVSKVCNVSMVPIAVEIIMGEVSGKPYDMSGLKEKTIRHYGVKEAVFPFNMFPEVDPLLGPEMLSTGEVLGMGGSVGEAFYKAQEATKLPTPLEGSVLISVSDADKAAMLEVAQRFTDLGFRIVSTKGTATYLKQRGRIDAVVVPKLHEGGRDIVEMLSSGEINVVVNTHSATTTTAEDDGYIRKEAIRTKTPYYTTMQAARAAAIGVAAAKAGGGEKIKSLQEYHAEIR
jgi:carbamoyl-phosphate synthase large subunit